MLGIGRFGPLGQDRDEAARRPDHGAGLDRSWPRPAALWDPAAPSAGSAAAPVTWQRGDPEELSEPGALAVLVSVEGLGPVTLGRLLVAFGGAAATLRAAAGPAALAVLAEAGRGAERGVGISGEVARRLLEAAQQGPRILERIRSAGVGIVTLADAAYPRRLREIEVPPHVLFVRGEIAALASDRAVAVVGTRRPTEAGRRLAGQVGAAVAREGASVVSGLAVGVDGAAHAAVVAEGGITVAVLGGGHGTLYPRAHARLADKICRTGGAVISELSPDVPPVPGTFPRRNRLISGLSEATVVIEAGERSGALVTAAWALEQGRGCFLVPGPLGAPASAGCLAFLRECPGEARVVAGIPELLEDLGLVGVDHAQHDRGSGEARVRSRARRRPPAADALLAEAGETERAVARALVAGAATVDELVAGLGLPVATVLGAITLLEGRGLVSGAYGRYRPSGSLAGVGAAGP